MKKILSIAMAVAMAATCMISASAQTAGDDLHEAISDSTDITVDVTLNDDDADTVYYVEVEWENTNFTYSADAAAVWYPQTHTYSDGDGVWDKTTADIDVTNHSNEAVGVTLAYTQAADDLDLTGNLSKTSMSLATGVGLTYDTAATDSSTFTIAGTPSGTGVAGTITVTLES